MKQIISTIKLEGVETDKLPKFLEHWKEIKDLPCEDLKIDKIDENTLQIRIYYPLDIFDRSVTQFITVLFGELSFIKIFGKVKFLDLELPKEVYKWFEGPKFGVEEIKKRFEAKDYPILISIIKPSLGKDLTTKKIKEKIKGVLAGGFHGIKDDEMQGNLIYAPLKERVKFAKKYGKYIPVLNLDNIKDYEKILNGKDSDKIGGVLLNVSTLGFSMLHEIRKITRVPLFSHPALQGVYGYSFSPKVFAMLHRLFGCDGYISPIAEVDYFNVDKEEEKDMVTEFTKELPIKKTLPILCGGARINNLKEIMIPYEKMDVPYGFAFGSQIFAYEGGPTKMCKKVVEKVKETKS